MKKITFVILAVFCAFSLSGCGAFFEGVRQFDTASYNKTTEAKR